MAMCLRKYMLPSCLILATFFASLQFSETVSMPRSVESSTIRKDISNADGEQGFSHIQYWKNLEKYMKGLINTMIRRSTSTIMREVYSRNVSPKCLSALLQLMAGMKELKIWAFKMLDSSGKIPEGVLSGTISSVGNYDECLSIEVDEPRAKITGQYCTVNLLIPAPKWRPFMSVYFPVPELRNLSAPDTLLNFVATFIHNVHVTTIKIGLCTPHACSEDDINKLLAIIPEKIRSTNVTELDFKLKASRCETKTSFQFSSTQVAFIYLFIAMVVLIFVATVLDLGEAYEQIERNGFKESLLKFLRCFSLNVNMRFISDYRCPDQKMKFVYGFSCGCIFWIMASNVFLYINFDAVDNLLKAYDMAHSVYYQMLVSRANPYQALIFISSFVMAYKWMKLPKQEFRIMKYLVKVYFRYTLPYMLLVAFIMLTPGWGSGPSWTKHMSPVYLNCEQNWWTNFLYINNYVNTAKMCLSSTWYISVSAQLHLIGFITLIALEKRPKIGMLAILFLVLGSFFAMFFSNLYNRSLPNELIAFIHEKDRRRYANESFYRTYYHLMAHCAGVLAGYFVAKHPFLKISQRLYYSVWVLSFSAMAGTLFLSHLWGDGNLPSPILCATYDAVGRLIWASFLFWVALSCGVVNTGLIYEIVSWTPFAFLSRLLFATVIFDPVITIIIFSIRKVNFYVSHLGIFFNLGGLLLINIVFSYIFYVGVESPIVQLINLLTGVPATGTPGSCTNSTKKSKENDAGPAKEQGNPTLTNSSEETKFAAL